MYSGIASLVVKEHVEKLTALMTLCPGPSG